MNIAYRSTQNGARIQHFYRLHSITHNKTIRLHIIKPLNEELKLQLFIMLLKQAIARTANLALFKSKNRMAV